MLVQVSSILTSERVRKNLGDLDSLANSIADVGLLHPIVVKPSMELVSGYRRLMAVKKLGYAEVEVTVVENINDALTELKAERDENVCRLDFAPSEAVAMGRAIEKVEGPAAENRKLATLKQGDNIPDREIFPIGSSGRTRDRVGAVVGMSGRTYEKAKAVVEAAESNPALLPMVVEMDKTGKVTPTHRKLKKQMEQEQVAVIDSNPDWTVTDRQDTIPCDLLITDPPYNILDETWDNISNFETFTREWLGRWNNCGARFFVSFWSQEYLFPGREWFDESLLNYEFQQLLIWHYPNNKSPQSRQKFKQTYEPIFFYRLKGCTDEVRIDSSTWGDEANDFDCVVAAVPQSNYNNTEYKEHPAQKPLKVMRWLILNLSKPGDLIVDPFAGSATAGIAAVQLGRTFHGIETNYLELAKRRMSQWAK